MQIDLGGKVALVTGSTRGIGWAIARQLAAHGARVIVNGAADESAVARAVAQLPSAENNHWGCRADVGDPAALKQLYQEVFKRFGRLDVLVNNAGIMSSGLLGMVAAEEIDRVLRVNVGGVILNMQYAARLMGRGGGGSIVNLASIFGTRGREAHTLYSASKAAVIGATLAAAKELAPKGVRVNAIAPGVIDTEMTAGLTAEQRVEFVGRIGLGRSGTPEEVAGAALFLASDLSAYITGQVLGVDGGMVL